MGLGKLGHSGQARGCVKIYHGHTRDSVCLGNYQRQPQTGFLDFTTAGTEALLALLPCCMVAVRVVLACWCSPGYPLLVDAGCGLLIADCRKQPTHGT